MQERSNHYLLTFELVCKIYARKAKGEEGRVKGFGEGRMKGKKQRESVLVSSERRQTFTVVPQLAPAILWAVPVSTVRCTAASAAAGRE